MIRVESNPLNYLAAIDGQPNLFSCVYGQDRSPKLAKSYHGEILPGGLKNIANLVRLLEGSYESPRTTTKRQLEQQIDRIESFIKSYARLVLILTQKETVEYELIIRMIEVWNIPEFVMIYASSVTAFEKKPKSESLATV